VVKSKGGQKGLRELCKVGCSGTNTWVCGVRGGVFGRIKGGHWGLREEVWERIERACFSGY